MKPYITFVILMAFTAINIIGQTPDSNTRMVARVDQSANNQVLIPMSFNKALFRDGTALKQLDGKKIESIELVYTANKLNPAFNQQQLNEARMKQFRKTYPELLVTNPSVTYVEQNGAASREEAKELFHGFIVHYTTPEKSLKRGLVDNSNLPQTFMVDNAQGGNFNHTSGSTVHIPANCVVHTDGSPVVGGYTISYTEYRNAAQIAFSDIPMTFDEAGKHFQFNSVGMYELRGSQEGKELRLTQPIVVDFNCTEIKDNVDFYELDDTKGTWQKKHKVAFKPKMADLNKAVPQVIHQQPRKVDKPWWKRTKRQLNEIEWKKYDSLRKAEPVFIHKAIRSEIRKTRTIRIARRHLFEFNQYIPEQVVFNGNDNANFQQSTLLAEGSSDPGHTYPTLVKGLNSPSFGVFNCDQIFRTDQQLSIAPTYIDEKTGKQINDGHVACVINLKMNGSFSFNPQMITCDPAAKIVILLFTESKDVYVFSAEKYAALKLENQGAVTLAMENISGSVKTSDDLKTYLGL
ncbi:MAG: hypothetical protein V4604_04875 [Bacteroidota bacterium]